MKHLRILKIGTGAVIMGTLLAACTHGPGVPKNSASLQAGQASAHTQQALAAFAQTLPPDDVQDREDAQRGLIARATGQIKAADGRVLKDFGAYDFVNAAVPDTVNPSLWRHAQLNAQAGLFKVTEGIYQLRGFDMGNITLIEGRTGWIVVDALTSREIAAAAMAFARQHLGNRPVTALIFTHSHVDHFGGALGIITPAEVARRRVPVLAPAGFMDEATSENLLAGTAMARRAVYQFGTRLPLSVTGNVDTGLGKDLVSGHMGILPPSISIDQANQELVLDGVRFVFHNMPGAEAPAELTFSIPERKAFGGAEILTQTMHNLLPIRGAKVRDALQWSAYLQQALEHSRDAEVVFNQHNWPVWGQARIASNIRRQRDLYKFMHDQTVRLMNQGLVPSEIAAQLSLPPELAAFWSGRGYYGDLRHNVKAIYQFYLGHYDGNPAHLDPLPPREKAQKYVAAMGGADKVLEQGRLAAERGDYRWAVELLQQLVFAAPDNAEAKELLARCHEQLGYRAESATWRNSYLTAAQELRSGVPPMFKDVSAMAEMTAHIPTARFLEVLATRLDASKAVGRRFSMNLKLEDVGEHYVIWLENAVLHFRRAEVQTQAQTETQTEAQKNADVSLSLSRGAFLKLLSGAAKTEKAPAALKIEGDRAALAQFLQLFDGSKADFPIVMR